MEDAEEDVGTRNLFVLYVYRCVDLEVGIEAGANAGANVGANARAIAGAKADIRHARARKSVPGHGDRETTL
ncbi:hypothetical protein ACU20_01250 [Actinobaculum suis]|nr:hypothetical protein ACU20_01250 [Actinobaculum suis]